MKLKIISDGTPGGTKVIDIASGELIENVSRVFWDIDVHKASTAHIEVRKCEVDVEIEGKIIEEEAK